MFGFEKQKTLDEVERSAFEDLETLRINYGMIRSEEMTHEQALQILLRRIAKKEDKSASK